MAKGKKPDLRNVILASELSMAEWLGLLGTAKWSRLHPHNCFPTDKHKKEYLADIGGVTEGQFRSLASKFLNKSGNYGATKDNFARTIDRYGERISKDDQFESEFDRRSLPMNDPQWEGVTWALDLLPDKPLDAMAVIRSYIRAHIQYFTNNMFYGHEDVISMIQEKYQVTAKLSCFISYGGPDEDFARKLYESLTSYGVPAFFFPVHAQPGKKLYIVMREGVNQYDRVILVCSKSSLDRPGVLNEITETLQREAREGGKEYLIPIRLDDYVFSGWNPGDDNLAQSVRDRVVADFTDAMSDSGKYIAALSKLMAVLSKSLKSG